MAIIFDRKESGMIKLFLDGKLLTNESISLVASPKIGQELWFNALDWDNLDTGFRGSLNRFTMYAGALTPETIVKPLAPMTPRISTLAADLDLPPVTASPWALLFPCVMVVLLLFFVTRRRKGLIRLSPRLGPASSRAHNKIRSYPRYFVETLEMHKRKNHRRRTDGLRTVVTGMCQSEGAREEQIHHPSRGYPVIWRLGCTMSWL